MLGPRGRLDVDERTNTLLVSDTATRLAQLQAWLHGRGTHLDSLDEEAVEKAEKMALEAA